MKTRVLVLIVDNDQEKLCHLSRLISELGHNFQSANSAEAALSHLENNFPDVVLMDLLLPDSDARQFIQSIRQNAPQARIVVMVRPGSEASIREALSWGASDFLEKPIHELRLACLMSHLKMRNMPMGGTKLGGNTVSDVFFNGDEAAYRLAQNRFQKALDMQIPLLVEGEPGTGKSTLARHFANIVAPNHKLLQLDAAIDDFELFKQNPALKTEASQGRKYTIVLKHVEAASISVQKSLATFISTTPHTFIATTRGRLLDHAKTGSVESSLYNVLSPLPVWLAPLRDRPIAEKALIQLFLSEANVCFGTGIQQVHLSGSNDQLAGFSDNLAGLKRAVFKAVSDHFSPVSPVEIQIQQPGNNSTASLVGLEPPSHSVSAQKNYAMIPLLDHSGQLRTLKALEQDALLFAYEHKNARVGQIAKSLSVGRTTLYRKLLELGLVGTTKTKSPVQTEIKLQTNHSEQGSIVSKAAKYAA